jgi:DNA-binding MarR family transcriptional regulator
MMNPRMAAKPVEGKEDRKEAIRSLYLESLQLVERLHRRLLDVIKDEFERQGRSDINAIQALLLFNIGNSELTAGELRTRGYYLGSNVSYNLKKLVELGFINHQRSRIDRRSVRVSLTPKGRRSPRSSTASTSATSARSNRSAASIWTSSADEPGPPAPRPLLERHHRLSHVGGGARCPPFQGLAVRRPLAPPLSTERGGHDTAILQWDPKMNFWSSCSQARWTGWGNLLRLPDLA